MKRFASKALKVPFKAIIYFGAFIGTVVDAFVFGFTNGSEAFINTMAEWENK